VHNPTPRYIQYGPNRVNSIEWTNREKFWCPDPTYQKTYGPTGTEKDGDSFKDVKVETLKIFYSTWRMLGHGSLKLPAKKAEMARKLADNVDMHLFWEGWLEDDQPESDRFKEFVQLVVLSWSQARLCDEFLQWGYNLEAFVRELPDDPRSAGIVTRFAEQRILEWHESGDWGGWEACHNQFPDSAKGLLCSCGRVRKLAQANVLVTSLANSALETCCDAC
jgi:hypothetical protein